MKKMRFWYRLKEDSGANLVEYALLVVFIAIVALAAVTLTGTEVNEMYDQIPPAFN